MLKISNASGQFPSGAGLGPMSVPHPVYFISLKSILTAPKFRWKRLIDTYIMLHVFSGSNLYLMSTRSRATVRDKTTRDLA